MKPIVILRPVMTGAVVLSLCACAGDYASSVTAFAAATDAATKSLVAYDEVATQTRNAQRMEAAISTPGAIRLRRRTCETAADSCVVEFREGDAKEGKAFPIVSLAPNHLAAMREISRYTKLLGDVAAADSLPKVKEAVSKATASVKTLAGLVPGYGAPVAALAPATGNFVVWLVGNYQQEAKREALLYATGEMQKVLPAAAEHFAMLTGEFHEARKVQLIEKLDVATKALRGQHNEANIKRVVAAAADVDAALKVSPDKLFADLVTSHDKLHKALAGDERDLAAAIADINRLATEANALLDIATQYDKALDDLKKLPDQ